MTNEWEACKWGDLVTLEYGKRLSDYEDGDGEYPVYGTDGKIGYHTEPLCEHPGVIIGRKGAYRGVKYSDTPFYVIDTAFYVEPKVDVDLRWAYYELCTRDINSMDTGSAIPSTSREDFYRLDVRVPPLSIQRRIAEILEAFDDKIELNRRMNETLEEMAQVLYRYWFVDFGPFQDREFKDTEALGPIPKRWEVGSLEDIVENVRGTVEPDNYPDSLPYIGLGDMPKGSIHLNEWQRAEEAGSKKRHFEEGHFLFGKLRPYFKKVGIAPVEGICSTDMLVLEPANEHTRSMALGQLIQDDFIDFTDQASTGTSHPRISWKRMRGYSLALPPVEVAREFEQLVDPWLELVTANIRENKSLSKTRDYLLSKLISGEIEVATAEQQAEEVAEVGDVSTA